MKFEVDFTEAIGEHTLVMMFAGHYYIIADTIIYECEDIHTAYNTYEELKRQFEEATV